MRQTSRSGDFKNLNEFYESQMERILESKRGEDYTILLKEFYVPLTKTKPDVFVFRHNWKTSEGCIWEQTAVSARARATTALYLAERTEGRGISGIRLHGRITAAFLLQ